MTRSTLPRLQQAVHSTVLSNLAGGDARALRYCVKTDDSDTVSTLTGPTSSTKHLDEKEAWDE